ncbi:unnamed protein product [Prunus armeniaca]|uniref:Uncharacterized protein n=1 Tax=Prunus armeniaca TaxID=36596 RepID=A0A6J5X354_PRUAR|nr:unnamed protein product [Prunus armeniaca]
MIAKALRIRKKVKKHVKSKRTQANKTVVEAAGYVKAQTNWEGKDITFHPNSSGRFEVIEMAREANFNPIEEYRWADDYSGIHNIYGDGSSGSGYDGSAVRRVKS